MQNRSIAQSRIIVAEATQESLSIIAGESGMTSVELTNLYLTLEALKEMAKKVAELKGISLEDVGRTMTSTLKILLKL